MPHSRPLVLIRGGGDLATGVAWQAVRSGLDVVICELETPLAVRTRVSLSTAVTDGEVIVDGLRGVLCASPSEARSLAGPELVPVLVAPQLPDLQRAAVVDARMAKVNIDTILTDAPVVVALGPGFDAGTDCDAVIETMRGPDLGRVIWNGRARANTGRPGEIAGHAADRVLRSPGAGQAQWQVSVGDRVAAGQTLGHVGGDMLEAPFTGVVRGLISPQVELRPGMKVGDVDPRDDPELCFRISDKALAVGAGAVEAFSGAAPR